MHNFNNSSIPVWPEFQYNFHELKESHEDGELPRYDLEYKTLVRIADNSEYYLVPVTSCYTFNSLPPVLTVLRTFIREVYKVQHLYRINGDNQTLDIDPRPEAVRIRDTYTPWTE